MGLWPPPLFSPKKSVSKMTLNGIKHIFSHYFFWCDKLWILPPPPRVWHLSHWLSSHYSGHQHPDNPTLLTSGAHAVIREIFKHSYYSKKYLSPSANRKYLKSLEIWQYIVHNIFLCSPKIFVSGPLMLKWYDMRCEDDIVGPFSHCFTMLKWHFPPATQ